MNIKSLDYAIIDLAGDTIAMLAYLPQAMDLMSTRWGGTVVNVKTGVTLFTLPVDRNSKGPQPNAAERRAEKDLAERRDCLPPVPVSTVAFLGGVR